MSSGTPEFGGAKIVLHCDGALVSYLRDEKPEIPFPGLWDLPGGGAEGDETPQACALRETLEEFTLSIAPSRITWGRSYPALLQPETVNWFFAASITERDIASIRFGDEGQCWRMMSFEDYLSRTDAIEHLQVQVRDFLAEKL